MVTGAVTGWAALRLLGGGFFDGLEKDGRTRLPVVIAAGADRLRSRPGVRVMRGPVSPLEVVTRYGVRCTTPERALFDLMRHSASFVDRVVAIDMAAAAGLTSVRRMRAYARMPRHMTGRFEVVHSLASADEHALSPQEVRLRLIWRRIFGPAAVLLCNPTVVDLEGAFVGMPDLLEPATGVTGEYVGAVHRTGAQHRRDVARADRFRRVGLEPVEFVGADLDDEDLVTQRIQAARARAARNERAWRVTPYVGPSLDERLDREDLLRARYGAPDVG